MFLEKHNHTVDGRNPAPVDMENNPIIWRVLYIAGDAGFLPPTVRLSPFGVSWYLPIWGPHMT